VIAYYFNLGIALKKKGQWSPAIVALSRAIDLKPDNPDSWLAWFERGDAYQGQQEWTKALADYSQVTALRPDFAPAWNHRGLVYAALGEPDKAIADFSEAIRLRPEDASFWHNRGDALRGKGDPDRAIASYREAIRLRKDYADAYHNLGTCYEAKGDLDKAISAYRDAIRSQPKMATAHYNLGKALAAKGAVDEAITASREAIRLNPYNYQAHNNLGYALRARGAYAEAFAAFREAIRLKPEYAQAHNNLGVAYATTGHLEKAVAAFRQTIRHQPDYAEAYNNLGHALREQGRFAEALAAYKRGHEFGSKKPGWPYPSKQWIQACEVLVKLDERLSAVRQGKAKPADAPEMLALARVCTLKKQHRAAARFFQEAFTEKPELADELRKAHRYQAACAAALAGCGQGGDAARLEDKERTRLRRQAVDWLRADLALWAKVLDRDDPKGRAGARKLLTHWRRDPDLAGLREVSRLVQLPKAERETYLDLWADVDALLTRLKPKAKEAPPDKR
jgi:tetratricopeptide (TPR) repeat protein